MNYRIPPIMNRNIFRRLSVLFCIILFTITKGYLLPGIYVSVSGNKAKKIMISK